MVAIIVITVLGIYKYIRHRTNMPLYCSFLALVLIFTSNIYIPSLFPHFYNHYTKVSQPWHNSTFLLMRAFSVWVIYYFFKIYDEIKDNNKISLVNAVCFFLSLSLCNFSKPNFILAFAPASILVFVYLLIGDKKRFKALFEWGVLYLLSLPCIIYMMNIVYDEAENSKVAISSENFVDYVLSNDILIYEISNLLFPLFVVVVFAIIHSKNRNFSIDRIVIGSIIFVISHIQQLLMIDDGPRKDAGNYAWGVYGIGLILFMIFITEWLRAYRCKFLSKKIFVIGVTIFVLHVISGIVYFVLLSQGRTYII